MLSFRLILLLFHVRLAMIIVIGYCGWDIFYAHSITLLLFSFRVCVGRNWCCVVVVYARRINYLIITLSVSNNQFVLNILQLYQLSCG